MKKILMIDDETDILEFFEHFIPDKLEGYKFFKADNGNAGLEIAEKEKPELAIVDMKLGAEPQGAEMLRRLKAVAPDTHTIVLTGFISPQMEVEVRDLDVYAYLEKPINLEVLLRMIQEVVPKD